jgi:NADPH:quinone reductase
MGDGNKGTMMPPPTTGLQLQSLISSSGTLELSLVAMAVPPPTPDDVVVQIEASPVNPSDLGLLLGPADLSTIETHGEGASRRTTMRVPDARLRAVAARLDKAMPVGNEGAGIIVATGDNVKGLLGKTVAVLGGGMYCEYRTVPASSCLAFPGDVAPVEAAASFVNPLTALGMVETMRSEGHSALLHSAAASNLGQMLNRLCQKDRVPLVNIVRTHAQAKILRNASARYVCDSSADNFTSELTEAIYATNATLAFDAIGGGRIASQILTAMESAASRRASNYSAYGSSVHKQVYIYGGLDPAPTELTRSYGMAWGIGGWLLGRFLQKIGTSRAAALRERVVAEIRSTFVSHYTQSIGLADLLRPDVLQAISRKATGEKFLVVPRRI